VFAEAELHDRVTLGDDVGLEPTSRVRIATRPPEETLSPLEAGLRPWRQRVVHHVGRAQVIQSGEIPVPVAEIVECLDHSLVAVGAHRTASLQTTRQATPERRRVGARLVVRGSPPEREPTWLPAL
jgi:hypothetical protein